MCEIQSNGNLICNDFNEEIKIDAEGSRPTSGTILMYEGKVLDASIINFSDKKYTYKDNEVIEIKEQDEYEFLWVNKSDQNAINEHYQLNKERCLEKYDIEHQYYCDYDAYQYTHYFGFNDGVIEQIKEPINRTIIYGAIDTEIHDVVVIPGGVIDIIVFYGGYEKTKLTIKMPILPSTLLTISDHAFYESSVETVLIPSNITKIGTEAFYHNKLKNIVIPGSVEEISNNAFLHNKLESIVIMEGVKSIGLQAFARNNLIEITIPSTVTYIDEKAFSDNNIEKVIIKNSPDNVEFGDSPFGWKEGSKCALWTGDIKENPCIHWEY